MSVSNKILAFFIIFSLQSCITKSNKNLICNDFKTGQFELKNFDDNRKYIISRNQNYQIEETYNLTTNEKIKVDRYYLITWINNCEYKLKIDTIKNKFDDFDVEINSLGGLKNKILKIEGKCAEIETRIENQIIKSKICKQ